LTLFNLNGKRAFYRGISNKVATLPTMKENLSKIDAEWMLSHRKSIGKTHLLEIDSEDTIFEAIKRMTNKKLGAIIVKEKGKLVGVFSEIDYARRVKLKGISSKETSVKKVMTSPVITTPTNTPLIDCCSLFVENSFSHLPISDGEDILGVISATDVVRSLVKVTDHSSNSKLSGI